MDRAEFKIYTAEKVTRLTPNKIVLVLFITSSILLFYTQDLNNAEFLHGLGLILMFLSMGLFLYFIITRHDKISPLDGTLKKKLIFDIESISIDQHKYYLDEISKLEFSIYDYYYRHKYMVYDLNPARSIGVNNKLILTLNDGQIIETQFQLMYDNQIRKIEKQLMEYHRVGILSFLHMIELLAIEDYNEIQEFKKRLPPT